MTFQEARDIVEAVKFRGMFQSVRAELTRNPADSQVWLMVGMKVASVDTGEQIPIGLGFEVHLPMLDQIEAPWLIHLVFTRAKELIHHELEECLTFSDVRVYDPHSSLNRTQRADKINELAKKFKGNMEEPWTK